MNGRTWHADDPRSTIALSPRLTVINRMRIQAESTEWRHRPSQPMRVVSDPRRAALWVSKADRNECIGFHVWVGEDSGTVLGEFERSADREVSAITAGREMRDDLAIVDREGDRARMGDQDHGGHGRARRLGPERHRPGQARKPRPLEDIRDRHLRVRPGQDRGGGRLEPRRDRADSVQVDDAVNPDVPWASVWLRPSRHSGAATVGGGMADGDVCGTGGQRQVERPAIVTSRSQRG